MSMIDVSDLTFGYEGSPELIFDHVSFQIDTSWKLGFTGRNGRGKTTFLRLLQGKYPYSGTISASVAFEYFPYEVTDLSRPGLEVVREIAPEELTAKDIFDVAKEGDRIANEVVENVCRLLASALAKICVVVDPEAVLIGGGVSKAGQILLDAIVEPFQGMAFHACKDTKILLASLGNDAGIYGGVRLILD